jgi:hypothetical protein
MNRDIQPPRAVEVCQCGSSDDRAFFDETAVGA